MSTAASTLIAVDIGNSRIKLGRFEKEAGRAAAAGGPGKGPDPFLPAFLPDETFDLSITDGGGQFDTQRLAAWCAGHVVGNATWLVASVHRGAAERFVAAVARLAAQSNATWPLERVTYVDVPLAIEVEQPERVGIDRLLAALAADRLRRRDRAAIVVDLGTAITVDLVDDKGAFVGGAILPGIAMSARALAEQTDALPRVAVDRLDQPPPALGKSTVQAIEAGLYWGAVGAIRELIMLYSAGAAVPPDVFITGGASADVAQLLSVNDDATDHSAGGRQMRHVPHLVLAGIAMVAFAAAPKR
jgi:type III pantothenate kinase